MRAPSQLRNRAAWLAAAALAGLVLGLAPPARAEFEIQESTIDEGEIQLQYRGAWHDGLPSVGIEEPLLPDDEEAPLRQSQEFELQFSVTSHWLVALTHAFDEPADDNFQLVAVEFENQIELITLEGDGFGLAVQGGFEQPVQKAKVEEPFNYHFGPILELAKDKFLLTLNPLFFKETGDLTDQSGFGFEYGWQAKYNLTEPLALALEMFGEIDDMSHAGPFDTQEHSIGPAFYYTFEKDWEEGDRERSRELVLSLGAQFGLTDETSDVALKVFVGYEYY